MVHIQTLSSDEKKLVGYTVTASVNEDIAANIIVRLRDKLMDTRHNIPHQLDNTSMYLVQRYPDCEWTPDVPFVHIVAVEVHEFSDIPNEFIQHTLPAGTYTKVTHHGPESTLTETYHAIQEQAICSTRPFDFEYWTNVHSLDQDDSVIEIYLPVEE